jgi:Putative phage tail protein
MTGAVGRGTNAKQPSAIGSLQYQTSQEGGAIPLVYGTCRVSGNLLDYAGFTSTPSSTSGKSGPLGKGGGGGKGGNASYMYSASFIMGLCQGPISNIDLFWYDKNVGTTLSGLSSINTGNDGQSADLTWAGDYSTDQLGYSGTANFVCIEYQLGNTATLPNISAEVYGIGWSSGVNGADANPAFIVYDFLTNGRYGSGFPLANLDQTMTNQSVANSYINYCFAAGIFMSVQLDTQQEAQTLLSTISSLSNSAIVWSGGLLKMIPYGDSPLTATYQLFGINGTVTMGGGDTVSLTFSSPNIQGGTPVTVTYTTTGNEQTYAAVGAGLAQGIIGTAALTSAGVWAGVGPSEVVLAFLDANVQSGVTITPAYTGGVTLVFGGGPFGPYNYTPNTQPIYSLGENDFIVQETSVGTYLGVTPGGPALRQGASPITGGFADDPLHIQRSTPADANNYVELECKDRGRSYNSHIIETFDQASVDLYGIRRDTSKQASAIVDPYLTGNVVASLILQRNLLYRNTYTFQLGWKYCLLEPMDLVQITDPRLGAAALTVRITGVQEDDEGLLNITAEDFFGAYSPTVLYPSPTFAPQPVPTILGAGGGAATLNTKGEGGTGGYAPNWNASAGATNIPLIFEPPSIGSHSLLMNANELWIALSGSPNWGGAQVYLSTEGESFALIGTITAPSIQGFLTATMGNASSANPDTTDTCSVNLGESSSAGTPPSISASNAASGANLCFVGGEFFSYETAEMIGMGASEYELQTLYGRGTFGNTSEYSHPTGTQFCYINQAIGRFAYPATLIGQSVSLKFYSFNAVGGGGQSMETNVPSFVYVFTGNGTTPFGQTTIGPNSFDGMPLSGENIWNYVFSTPSGGTNSGVKYPVGLSGSSASTMTAAQASATFSIQKNGRQVGTMNFAAGATGATFTMATATLFQGGDVISIVAPTPADATLANISWTFVGSYSP